MSPHIIGRPDDDLLDIILGNGADPEQAFIAGREQGDRSEDHLLGEEPTGRGPLRTTHCVLSATASADRLERARRPGQGRELPI